MSRPGWAEMALTFFSLLGSGLVVELYLRRLNPIDSILYEMHPRYLYRLVPGARRLFFRTAVDGEAARVLVTVNGAGFRGPEIRSRPGLRIVVYGDSFVMSPLTPLEQTLPQQLETKLEEALRRPVEAINAGIVGYGPDQVSLRLEDELGSLTPDVVVVVLYAGNDFGDLMRNKIYRLGPDQELALNPYRLSRRQVKNFPDQPADLPLSMLVRGLRHLVEGPGPTRRDAPWSRGPEKPEDTLKRYLIKSALEYDRRGTAQDAEVDALFGDTYNADVSLTPDAPSAQYSARLMERVMMRMAALAAARGVPILFLVIPAALDVCAGAAKTPWAAAVHDFPAYRRDGLTSLLAGLAGRNGFEHIDLFRPFEAAGACSLYFPKDGHWNAAGQELAANVLKDHLIVRGMVR